jgi:hypothetical protein
VIPNLTDETHALWCEDWTDMPFQEDIYVDIRAYGTYVCSRFCVMRCYL